MLGCCHSSTAILRLSLAWISEEFGNLTRPHPVLPGYYEEPRQRESFVRSLFDASAADYERVNKIMSLGSGNWYRRRVLRLNGLKVGHAVLDIAVGTGLLAREARAITGTSGSVVGLDASFGMLTEAKRSLDLLVHGRAEALPFPDASFDMATMGYALRHIEEFEVVFAELRRVLKPGGRVLILEVARTEDRFSQAIADWWLGHAMPSLCRLLMRGRRTDEMMRYFWDTIHECVPPQTIERELVAAGFSDVASVASLRVFREYSGVRPH